MSITKEFREFFLRNVKVNSGAKADQESGFAVTYFIDGVSKFNRFLKGHFPSENVTKKLFESITFKLNKEDRATANGQGLVVTATDANVRDKSDNAQDGTAFTAVVLPHQLPEIEQTLNPSGYTDTLVSTVIANGVAVSKYSRLQASTNFFWKVFSFAVSSKNSIELNSGQVQLKNDTTTPGNNYVYGTDNTGTKGWYSLVPAGTIVMYNGSSAPTGWSLCDGTNGTPDLRGKFIVSIGQDTAPASSDLNPTYALGDNGGENTHQLTANELPKHTHRAFLFKKNDAGNNDNATTVASGTGTDDTNINKPALEEVYTDSAGTIESTYSRHENRPPYYALAYIMKL